MHDFLRTFLQSIGEDPDREGLRRTPERWAEALQEFTSGYSQSPEGIAQGALFSAETEHMIVVQDIDCLSLCEHHLLPFIGKAHIGYLPGKHTIGLSKIPRIVEVFTRRLQTQERLGEQICDALESVLQPKGVGVVIEAEHLCMAMRGVKKRGILMRTHHFSGEFLSNAQTREEFLHALCDEKKGGCERTKSRYDQ